MFRSGQLHYTNDVPTDKIPVYRNEGNPSLRVAPYLGSYFYRINTNVPHLQDKRVRRALAMAIDREQITEHILQAGQMPTYALTPPGTMGYYPKSDLTFDPEAAKQLLAEAGYPNGEGFPVTEILYNTNESHRKVAVAIQQMWNKYLNIEIKLLNQEWKVYLDSESAGQYTISRASWIGDYVDPNSFLDLFLCNGGNNRTGWCNAEYDRLILDVAPKMKSHEERLAVFQEAETLLLDAMPMIPIYIYTSKHLMNSSVKNHNGNLLDQTTFKELTLESDSSDSTGGNH